MRTAATFQTGLSGSIPGGEHWGIIEGANEGFQNLRQQCGVSSHLQTEATPCDFSAAPGTAAPPRL